MCSCPCAYEDAALISSQGLAERDTLSEYPADSEAVSARLSVARLTLTDFRCFRRQRLETDPRPVVLAGPNGAGKTNLLEAISYLSPGRGLRRAKLSEVDRIEVRWPDGLVEVFSADGVDRIIKLNRGEGREKKA